MKTIIKTETLNNIDTLQFTSKDANKLLFLQHGIYGNKEKIVNLLGVSFVKLGYHVIGIDAYKHGSRIEEPFLSQDKDLCELETMDVVKHTANDIKNLFDNHFKSTYKTFDIAGISMGGLTAYYLSTITKDIDHLIALISSPKFLEAAHYHFPKERQILYSNSEEVLNHVESIDPSRRVEDMTFKTLIMMNGLEDDVIPYEQSESFYNRHKDHFDIIYKTYTAEHKITKAMHEDLLDLLKKSHGG